MANILHVERTDNKITLGTTGTTIVVTPLTASKPLALNVSKELESIIIGTSLDYTRPTLNAIQDIRTSANPQFAGIELGHTSDTTITRVSAGVVAIEGTNIAMVGGAHHDGFSDFVANEHIDHTSVTFTAGTGLTGGGDISANRTFAVDGLLEDLDTLGANSADSEFLVGTGAGALAWESGATVRTSIGLGNVENTQLSTWAGSGNITTVGALVSGSIAVGFTEIPTARTAAKCTVANADNTATNETSHATVVVDGDFTSNGILNRTGAGAYSILALGTDVQVYHANLAAIAGATWTGANSITTLGTIGTGTWGATDVAILHGGTGQSTAQAAIDALTAVSGATNEHVLTKDTASGNATWKVAAGGSSGYLGYIKLSDTQAQNTEGGEFASGAWRTRVLNTEDSDTNNDCALNANQITLAAGTYECHISCPGFRIDRHQTRLYNTTGAATILIGTSEVAIASSDFSATRSFVIGRFTIAASQALEVQHQCQTTRATNGFGIVSNFTSEIYTIAEFWRVS